MTGYNSNSDPSTTLKRSADQKIFAGVCGGLGEHFDINAWWFRWAFIILAFFGFAGLALYILAWLLIPRSDGSDSVAGGWSDDLDLSDAGKLFGVTLLGVAALLVATSVFRISGAIVVAAVLGVVGFLLYRGDIRPPVNVTITRDDDDPGSGGPAIPEDEPPGPGEDDTDTAPADTPSAGAAASVATKPRKTPKPPKVKKPRPPRSMLGRLTMAVLLIALSSMALVELSGSAHFQPVEYLAAGMGIIAVGLLVGAWIGRARWLIVVGILLAPWLFFASLLPTVSEWTFGDPYYQPVSVEQIQDSYSLSGGQMTIDFSRFTAEELAEVGTVEASVSAGNIFIILPLGAGTVVNVDVGAGSVDVGVKLESDYSGPPQEVIDAFEDCLAQGIGDEECEDRHLTPWPSDGGIEYAEYGWAEWHSFSGIGISRSFDLGVRPRDFVLDLRVGAGGINIQQLGERDPDDRHEG